MITFPRGFIIEVANTVPTQADINSPEGKSSAVSGRIKGDADSRFNAQLSAPLDTQDITLCKIEWNAYFDSYGEAPWRERKI